MNSRFVSYAAMVSLQACTQMPENSGATPKPDGVEFVTEVYPVLLRDCAFSNCHGAPERFLQIYGPGRTRLDDATGQDDPMLLDEMLHSYDRARSMLGSAKNPRSSLLLRKPLELSAGGQTHRGEDSFGRNIFPSQHAAGYVAFALWAQTVGDEPTQDDVDAANAAASQSVSDWLGG